MVERESLYCVKCACRGLDVRLADIEVIYLHAFLLSGICQRNEFPDCGCRHLLCLS